MLIVLLRTDFFVLSETQNCPFGKEKNSQVNSMIITKVPKSLTCKKVILNINVFQDNTI